MTGILYIFPDTNLFIQCKPLDELDWARWKDFAEIHLLVSRPVQAEIDAQKDWGNGRVRKKARAAVTLFREVITATDDLKIIQADGPCVKLILRNDLRPDPMLTDVLNYAERDDQLIGVAHGFSKLQPTCAVWVLTHDTGPMATAKMVGLAFEPIPEDWLLPPEASAPERKIAALESEVQRLKNERPQFQISFQNGAQHWGGAITYYPVLSKEEIGALLERLQRRFPKQTEFRPPSTTPPSGNMIAMAFYALAQPPTDQQIRDYAQHTYPNWVDRCKRILAKYHRGLRKNNTTEQFQFLISNNGTKPAKDALITIRATGNFLVRSPFDDDEVSELPLPPEPPRHPLDGIAAAAEYFGGGIRRIGPPQPRQRDHNSFYWKGRSEISSKDINLECAQWRHDMAAEGFYGNIEPEDDDDIKGAIVCEVRAENLPETATMTVPLRLKVVEGDTYRLAMKEIDSMEPLPRAELL